MELGTNEVWLSIIFAVAIAGITEVVKHFDEDNALSAKQIDLLTLIMGIAMGFGAMYGAHLELSVAMTIGVGGSFLSTKIYETLKNWLGFNREETE